MKFATVVAFVIMAAIPTWAYPAAASPSLEEMVKQRIVRVDLLNDDGTIRPGQCGAGLLVSRTTLLTAKHVVPDGTTRLRLRTAQVPDGIVVSLDQLFVEAGIGGVDDIGTDDVLLLPLGEQGALLWNHLPYRDRETAFAQFSDRALGGEFSANIIPPMSVICSDTPGAGKTVTRQLARPRVMLLQDGSKAYRAEIDDINGQNASGSPVLSAHSGHVIGIYVGARSPSSKNGKGQIVSFGSESVRGLWNQLDKIDIADSRDVPPLGFGLRAYAAAALPPQSHGWMSIPEFGASMWLRVHVYSFDAPRIGFDNFALEFELGYRGALKQQMQAYRAPGTVRIIEDVQSQRHGASAMVHLQLSSYYRHHWTLGLGAGIYGQCAASACDEYAVRTGQHVGFSVATLRASWGDAALGYFAGYRLDLAPNRRFSYQLFGDLEQVGDTRTYVHVIEIGVTLGTPKPWRLVY